MKHYTGLIALLLIFLTTTQAQEKKSVEAIRITSPLNIDGILNEAVYSQAIPAKDFVQLQPQNGKPALEPTEVFFFFDQSAIYVGAHMYDNAPDSIFNFLSERDNIGMSDYFGVYIDPFNQGQLAFGFFINPSGVQVDIKASKNPGGGDNEESNWNAVWESKTRMTDKGWDVEMRIPYSELRFSKNTGSVWGLNMFRNTRRYASNTSWSLIDRKVEGFIDQQGHLSGIKDIDPPVRLSFSPYLATYVETKDQKSDFLYKGGLDLKYGINESFTLDMMLIPDFGQIQSDDKQLNLSPYEIYYSEKRQFFTESTELFQRGNIFYSRRIGASPKFSDIASAKDNENLDYSPNETQLINATKISGRTSKGWGLGVLNAMSLPSYSKIKNTESGAIRKVLVQPFTNYNVAVLDKSLKNNSYISLINSNVSMADNLFRANVTATEFQLRNKAKTYVLNGKGAISVRGEKELESGYSGVLGLKKNKGDLQFGVEQSLYSDTYNPNDLGYLQNNNSALTSPWIYYQIIEPFAVFREVSGQLWWNYIRVYNPGVLSSNKTGYQLDAQFKNNYSVNFNGGYQTKTLDYFEPRVKGRFYESPQNFWCNFNLNTDWRKPVNFYFYYGLTRSLRKNQFANMGEVSANCRVGQHFKINYNLYFNNTINDIGYVDNNSANDSIHFSKRNVQTLSNVLYAEYVINNKSSLSLRGRHYWSGARNKIYYLLQQDGSLLTDQTYTENQDQNYNAFTIDMTYRWVFAPGSELVVALKNAAYTTQNKVVENYWQNLGDSWLNQGTSISLKILYYIDYNKMVHRK